MAVDVGSGCSPVVGEWAAWREEKEVGVTICASAILERCNRTGRMRNKGEGRDQLVKLKRIATISFSRLLNRHGLKEVCLGARSRLSVCP